MAGLSSTYSGLYNKSSCGFPDVTAVTENTEIYLEGVLVKASRSNNATPVFASVISLINDKLIAGGKSPLGFLNPFVYANPSIFNYIMSRTNPRCNTNGFSATAGWDPVTGLGTPIYSKISAAAGL